MNDLTHKFNDGVSPLTFGVSKKDYSWQTRARDAVKNAFDTGKEYFYVIAHTGAGKSTFIRDVCLDTIPAGENVLITVGRSQIADEELCGSFEEYEVHGFPEIDDKTVPSFVRRFDIGNGRYVDIATWQGALAATKNGSLENYYLFILDECHLGTQGENNTALQDIIDPLIENYNTKRLYVTATPEGMNFKKIDLMDRDHSFFWTIMEGVEANIYNEFDIVSIFACNQVVLENFIQKNGDKKDWIMETLNKEDDPVSLYKIMCKKGVDVTVDQIKQIKAARLRTMIEYHLTTHPTEKCLYFVPSVEVAEEAARNIFGVMAIDMKRTRDIKNSDDEIFEAVCVHSSYKKYKRTKSTNLEAIRRFKHDQNVKAMFVVGMLREGFNMPELRLVANAGFYSQYNEKRIGRFLQEIGRASRTLGFNARGEPNKQRSEYIFCRDFMSVVRSVGEDGRVRGYSRFNDPRIVSVEEILDEALVSKLQEVPVMLVGAANRVCDTRKDIEIKIGETKIIHEVVQFGAAKTRVFMKHASNKRAHDKHTIIYRSYESLFTQNSRSKNEVSGENIVKKQEVPIIPAIYVIDKIHSDSANIREQFLNYNPSIPEAFENFIEVKANHRLAIKNVLDFNWNAKRSRSNVFSDDFSHRHSYKIKGESLFKDGYYRLKLKRYDRNGRPVTEYYGSYNVKQFLDEYYDFFKYILKEYMACLLKEDYVHAPFNDDGSVNYNYKDVMNKGFYFPNEVSYILGLMGFSEKIETTREFVNRLRNVGFETSVQFMDGSRNSDLFRLIDNLHDSDIQEFLNDVRISIRETDEGFVVSETIKARNNNGA